MDFCKQHGALWYIIKLTGIIFFNIFFLVTYIGTRVIRELGSKEVCFLTIHIYAYSNTPILAFPC